MASVLILKNANVYSPHPIGGNDILCIEGKIAKIGKIDAEHFHLLGIPYEIIDLEGAIAFPGIIDPHMHIIGGSGEKGYCSRSPEMTIPEIISGGITTVVGCIGVDTFTRNMKSLLAQAKYYNEEGLTAHIWSGGYPVPPSTLTESIETDIILVSEVIGAGEIAISDIRSASPTLTDIAKIVSQSYVAGLLTGKSGVTHFHLGDGKNRLQPLFNLLNEFDVSLNSLYPTHVNRNPELLIQGAEITRLGVTIDFDTCDGDLIPSLQNFIKYEGDLNFLTLSSDASYVAPSFLYDQMREAMETLSWPLEKILPLVTTNTAKILKLYDKGKITEGADADIVVASPGSLDILHVIAKGKFFMRDKKIEYSQKCLINSNRKIEIYGKKERTR